jgi:hypothetical protein
MDGCVIIPAPTGDDFVELSARDRKVTGRLFRKHILNKGTLIHPKTGERLRVDDSFVNSLQRNFSSGVCDIVQVPLANEKNQHVEGPVSNIGEVVGVESEGSKVYALIDARDEDAAGKLGKTYLGASALLHMNYPDTVTGDRKGPTLLHVAVTNRPYVTGLEDYEEVLAATMDADEPADVLVLSEEDSHMDKAELIAQLKAEHGIDVEALQAGHGDQPAGMSELTAALTQALSGNGQVELTGPDGQTVGLPEIVGAVAELASLTRNQGDEISGLRRERAESEVDGYIGAGRVLPKQRESFVRLAMEDRDELAVLLPDSPVVPLSQVRGAAPPQGEDAHERDIDKELAELTAGHPEFFSNGSGGK